MCAYNYNLFVIIKKKKKKTHTQYFCVKGTLDFYFMVSPKANRGELIKKYLYIYEKEL